jgi:hypothetical protein
MLTANRRFAIVNVFLLQVPPVGPSVSLRPQRAGRDERWNALRRLLLVVTLSYEGTRGQAMGLVSRYVVECAGMRVGVREAVRLVNSSCSFGRNVHCENDCQMPPVLEE